MATIKKYLKYNIFLLRIFGLWTDQIFSKSKYRYYHLFVYTFCITSFNILQVIYSIVALGTEDLELFATSVSPTVMCLLPNIKAVYYIRKFSMIQNLTLQLDEPHFQPKNKRQEEQAWSFVKVYLFIYYFFSITAWLVWLLWISLPLSINRESRKLPLLLWYPYDEKQPLYYAISYIHQSVALFYIVGGNMNIDLFTCGLMTCIGIECDCLSDTLENLHDFAAKVEDTLEDTTNYEANVSAEMNKALIAYGVKQYLKIQKFTVEIGSYINYSIFIQFAVSLVATCTTMFQLTVMSTSSVDFVVTVMYQAAVLNELFLYCWFGNEVIDKSSNIANGLYNCNWEDYSLEFKKNLLFIMQRSQRPIQIYAIDFFVVSIPTFTAIIKTAYSAFAVLRRVHDE